MPLRTKPHSTDTNEAVLYSNGTVNSTSLHYYLMKFVVNSHVQDPGQSFTNDNFTVASIIKNTYKE